MEDHYLQRTEKKRYVLGTITVTVLFWINAGIVGGLMLIYLSRAVYMVVGLFVRKRFPDTDSRARFAAIICARNEECVIRGIIDSLKSQNYPQELIDVFVVADNCDDKTAEVARDRGAFVYERFDESRKGKGYALDYAMKRILTERKERPYDAFVFFDADNIADENFVSEMNKVLADGKYDGAMGYRNSKNFGSSWVSMGSSVSFIYESRFSHGARSRLGFSTYMTGTGMMVRSRVFDEMKGYVSTTMVEDVELSVQETINGKLIGYNCKAMIYDEQPVKLKDSFYQRVRWIKGQFQCFKTYGGKLLKRAFLKHDFSCLDMFNFLFPGHVIGISWTVVYNAAILILGIIFHREPGLLTFVLLSFLVALFFVLATTFILGLITVLAERKRIRATAGQKIKAVLTFPFFLFTYIPIVYYALFKKVEWRPIPHGESQIKPK